MVQTTSNTRNIAVSVAVSNFTLADKMGEPPVSGEGHIIYYLDVNPPIVRNRPALTTGGSFERSAETSFTWTKLLDGPHMLAAQLVNNDDTPLSPPVFSWIQTYLQFDILAPRVEIISPHDGSDVKAGDVTITVRTYNFVVVDRLDAPNLAGQGHLPLFY